MTEVLRVLLADDEDLARAYLKELMEAHPELQLVGEAKNGLEVVQLVQTLRPELLFLDIEMPKLNGFEALDLLSEPPMVIFTTAYDTYAVQAFDASAVDYLLKPYSAERLARALERALGARSNRWVANSPQAGKSLDHEEPEPSRLVPEPALASGMLGPPQRDGSSSPQISEGPLTSQRIFVKEGSDIGVIAHQELLYVRSEDDYVRLVTAKRSWLKHQSLQALEQSLPPSLFVRIHRSCLVNLLEVERIESETRDRWLVHLRDGTVLPASRKGEARLREIWQR